MSPDRTAARTLRVALAALAAAAACSQAGAPIANRTPVLGAPELARAWDERHVSPALPPLLDHADLVRRLEAVRASAPELFSLERIGESVEGRSISHVSFGRGPFRVLLWSQMHGDEPTATAALLDVYDYVARHRRESRVARILDVLSIHTVPMLNPDGARRFQRRNAQGIDINRDALLLQTPEGRALKALRDRLSPGLGFNLHNQSWRTSVGNPPAPAAISLLAVAFDERRSESPGRLRATKVAAVIRDAIEPFASGRIGRYDDTFEVRAFGDNVTRWGTPVVLIETGAWPGADPDLALVRLNFVGILSALDALATGRVDTADPARYERLPMNESMLFSVKVKGASIVTGTGVPPFTGDIGLVATRSVRDREGRRELVISTRVDDIGDLRVYGALEDVDAAGLTAAPAFEDGLQPGATVRLPDWSAARPDARRITIGAPADLLLLRPSGDGGYRVERVLRSERVTRH
jgi:hypothetical protein